MTVELEIEVYGMRDTLALLRQMDQKTKWAAINKIKASGGELVNVAREHFPTDPPLRGWTAGTRGGRLGWRTNKVQAGVQIQVGGRAPRYADAYPMVTLIQKDPAGALFDIAGLRNNSKSQAETVGQRMFTRYLTDGTPSGSSPGYGKSQRGMWRNIRKLNEVGSDAIRKAIEEVAADMNRKLVT